MKLTHTLLPLIPLATLAISSCVVAPAPVGVEAAVYTPPVVGVGVYDVLPVGFTEPYYFYGGHYYYGGHWENDRYYWHGHYLHGGHYYHGHDHDHHEHGHHRH